MPAGGAQWAAYAPGDDSESHVADGPSLTFSFIPLTGGNWSSFYNDSGDPNFAGAGVDPGSGPEHSDSDTRAERANRGRGADDEADREPSLHGCIGCVEPDAGRAVAASGPRVHPGRRTAGHFSGLAPSIAACNTMIDRSPIDGS